MIQALVIIPAKLDSVRLKYKNLQLIGNKTLIDYAIDYAKKSDYVKGIVISTESDKIKALYGSYSDVVIFNRDESLLADADTIEVYQDVAQELEKIYPKLYEQTTHFVGLQPDNPDRTVVLDEVLEFVVKNNYDDFISIDKTGKRNGSLRIVKRDELSRGRVSKKIGCIIDGCTNIHTQEDLDIATKNISARTTKLSEIFSRFSPKMMARPLQAARYQNHRHLNHVEIRQKRD